jgi:hypothetical protein
MKKEYNITPEGNKATSEDRGRDEDLLTSK